MLDDWFRSVHLAISFAEFQCLPRHLAYKYEYFGGRAVLTPRPHYHRATLALPHPAPLNTTPLSGADEMIRPLNADDWAGLPRLFAAAFSDVAPFAHLSERRRLGLARDCVDGTRSGRDGPTVNAACFAAVGRAQEKAPLGALIVTLTRRPGGGGGEPPQPHLTWVLVQPWRFRRGLGTALLGHAVAALSALGHRELDSTFQAGNERSALWHWRNGFHLRPDPFVFRPLRDTPSRPA